MSGGSWDYIAQRYELHEDMRLSEMQAMLDRMRELSLPSVVIRRQERLVGHVQAAHRLARELVGVWHDVEWVDSGDYCPGTVRRHIWKSLGSPPCTHEERDPWGDCTTCGEGEP